MKDTGPNDTAQSPAAAQSGADDLMREQRLQRNLKVVVGLLSLLILTALAAVIVKVFTLAAQPGDVPSEASSGVARPLGQISLELPRGARIVSVSASNGRIVVHYESPAGAGVAVLDLETGQRIYDVKPIEPPN